MLFRSEGRNRSDWQGEGGYRSEVLTEGGACAETFQRAGEREVVGDVLLAVELELRRSEPERRDHRTVLDGDVLGGGSLCLQGRAR